MDPVQYLQCRDANSNTDILINLIESLKKQGYETGVGTNGAMPKHGGWYDVTSEKRTKCRDRVLKFRMPLRSVAEHQALAEQWRLQCFRQHKLKQECAKRNGEDPSLISVSDSIPPTELKSYVQSGLRHHALHPETRMLEDRPLLYAYQPSLEDYEHCLIQSPMSKVLDLCTTIHLVTEEAEQNGLDDIMLGQIFKEIVKEFYPTLLVTCEKKRDVMDILDCLLAAMNTDDDIHQIQLAIEKVKRVPGVSIRVTAQILVSLQIELYTAMNPHQEIDKIKTRANRQVKRIISNFVNDKVKQKYLDYKELADRRNEDLSLDDVLDYISQLERKEGYGLKEEKVFDKNLSSILVYGNKVNKGKGFSAKKIGRIFNRGRDPSPGPHERESSVERNRPHSGRRSVSRDSSSSPHSRRNDEEDDGFPLRRSTKKEDGRDGERKYCVEYKDEDFVCGNCKLFVGCSEEKCSSCDIMDERGELCCC